jgi:hypothetical protein
MAFETVSERLKSGEIQLLGESEQQSIRNLFDAFSDGMFSLSCPIAALVLLACAYGYNFCRFRRRRILVKIMPFFAKCP